MPLYGAPGERIAYTIHDGPPGAPPALLVHGFTASSAAYIANVEGLRQHFTVITTDLLGHGNSDAPEDPAAYGPGPAIARFVGLLDHLGFDRVLLVGHSLGGALSLRFALAAPERIAGLVLINSSTAAMTPDLFEAAQPRYAMMAARAREEGLGFMEESSLNPAHSKWLPDEAREALLRDFRRMTPAGFAGTTEGLTAQVNSWEQIPDLEVPTLVVIGDRDPGFLRVAPGLLERLPAVRTSWVTLEGAGHAANLSAPEAFNDALIAFARDIGYLPEPERGTPRKSGVNSTLTMLGSALIVAGFAMLGAAFLFRGGGGSANPASFEPFGNPTPTPVQEVAGVITQGPAATAVSTPGSPPIASPSPQPASPTAETATPTPAPAVQSTPVVDVPAEPTVEPVEEPTEEPTAETPTEEPTPAEPTAPAGPAVFLSGPTEIGFGETGIFIASATSEPLRWEWSGCNQGLTASSCSRVFSDYSCQTVAVTAIMPDGSWLTRSLTVAVGGVTC